MRGEWKMSDLNLKSYAVARFFRVFIILASLNLEFTATRNS
jgi:hypothetical protein